MVNKMKQKNNKIYWKKALELLKNDVSISEYQVYFDDEKIEVLDAFLLDKHGVEAPENLIYYDDDTIDYSDIPPTTDEEFRLAKLIGKTGLFPIDQKRAIKKLKNGDDISVYDIYFDGEKIEKSDADLLCKNNIEVPEDLIYYDDKINYANIP